MPISVPPVPQLDYSNRAQFNPEWISGLGDALLQASDRRRKIGTENRTQDAFKSGIPMRADGSPDYAAMAARLFEAGNVDTGLGLTRLAETQSQNDFMRGKPTYQEVGDSLLEMPTERGQQPREVYRDPDAGSSSAPAGYRKSASGDLEPVPGGPADLKTIGAQTTARTAAGPPRSRVLPQNSINALTSAGSTAADFDRLAGTWKDEYGGKYAGPLGDAQNLIGRNVGAGYGDQASWWQDYQSQKNIIRNKLFGSALTATEKGEFEKANINPGMTSAAIVENLKRQQMVANRAAKKLASIYIKQGYSPDLVESAIGIPLGDLGVQSPQQDLIAKPALPQAPSIDEGPQPGDIEDGYQFKGGDPSDPNSWEQVQ